MSVHPKVIEVAKAIESADDFYDAAVRAIGALTEPDESMIDVGAVYMCERGDPTFAEIDARAVYTEMVRSILSPKQVI